MPRLLSFGSNGSDVAELQQQLNADPPSDLPTLAVDGMFGPATLARVKEFQTNNGLQIDGIVGPATRAALEGGNLDVPARTGCDCGNDDPLNQAGLVLQLQQALQAQESPQPTPSPGFGLTGAPVSFSRPALPSAPKLQLLTAAQVATARAVFGASIDYSAVFISDK